MHPPLFLTSAIQMIFGMPLVCIIMRAISAADVLEAAVPARVPDGRPAPTRGRGPPPLAPQNTACEPVYGVDLQMSRSASRVESMGSTARPQPRMCSV